jgi:phage baseplate assembly protein gpV
MKDNTVKGTKKLTTANTLTNAMTFLIEQNIRAQVNTADVVSIDRADQAGTDGPAGYAAATPLVCQVDARDNALPPSSLPKLPFFRPQAGKAAIVMDPQPGDKAVAVFLKRDSSGVATGKKEPVQPGSFRMFDQADGYLINGFLGDAPEIWLHLNPATGDISLSTKTANIDISCRESGDIDIRTGAGNVTVSATGTAVIKAPDVVLNGNARITGNLTVDGICEGAGGAAFTTRGGIHNQGGVIRSNAVTLDTHTHTGVQPGGGSTGKPNSGA